jgi:hypothetical protein
MRYGSRDEIANPGTVGPCEADMIYQNFKANLVLAPFTWYRIGA